MGNTEITILSILGMVKYFGDGITQLETTDGKIKLVII